GFGDHGRRAIMLSLIFNPVIENENGGGMPAPLTDQSRADFRDERGIEGPAFLRKFSGQGLKAPPQCSVRPASSTLLQLMGEGADQQIATEPLRRAGAVQFAPCKPQVWRRATEQIGQTVMVVEFSSQWRPGTSAPSSSKPTGRNVGRLRRGRLDIPRRVPPMSGHDLWDSNRPGSTLFLPVCDVSASLISLI